MLHTVFRPPKESEREKQIKQHIDLFRRIDEIMCDAVCFREYLEKQCGCQCYGHKN